MAEFPNVIVVEGEEYYLRKKKIEEIVEKILSGGFSDFNYLKLDGKKVSLREILSSFEELPFGAPKRVVHVEDFDKVKVKSSEKKIEKMFVKAISSGNITKTFLILECNSLDKRSALNKSIAKVAKVFSFKKKREWEFPSLISEYCREKGYKIDRDGVDLIASSFSDLMSLFSELDKLFAYKKDDKTITVEDIRKVIFPSKEYTFFDIQDAIIARNAKKTFKVANSLLESGVSLASIFGFLESSFKKAYNFAFEEKPKNPSFYERKLLSLASIFGRQGIEKSLVIIYKVLALSRKGTLSDGVYLNYLITFLNKISGAK